MGHLQEFFGFLLLGGEACTQAKGTRCYLGQVQPTNIRGASGPRLWPPSTGNIDKTATQMFVVSKDGAAAKYKEFSLCGKCPW